MLCGPCPCTALSHSLLGLYFNVESRGRPAPLHHSEKPGEASDDLNSPESALALLWRKLLEGFGLLLSQKCFVVVVKVFLVVMLKGAQRLLMMNPTFPLCGLTAAADYHSKDEEHKHWTHHPDTHCDTHTKTQTQTHTYTYTCTHAHPPTHRNKVYVLSFQFFFEYFHSVSFSRKRQSHDNKLWFYKHHSFCLT